MQLSVAIARLDKLSRNEAVQAKLGAPDCRFELIVSSSNSVKKG